MFIMFRRISMKVPKKSFQAYLKFTLCGEKIFRRIGGDSCTPIFPSSARTQSGVWTPDLRLHAWTSVVPLRRCAGDALPTSAIFADYFVCLNCYCMLDGVRHA